MKHKLKISFADESPRGGIVTCKKKTMKSRLIQKTLRYQSR